MPKEQPKQYNEELVKLASPIILNMPLFFGKNIFTRESFRRVLIVSNCPQNLVDEVLRNCELAGILRSSDNGKTFTIITKKND